MRLTTLVKSAAIALVVAAPLAVHSLAKADQRADLSATDSTVAAATIASGKTYRLRSAKSGLCLDVPGGSKTAGVKLQQWTCNGLDPQNWKFTSKGSGYFTLTSEQSRLCLDVPSSSTSRGVRVQQWGCNGTNAQLWHVVSVAGGYNLVSKVSGLCLDVASGSMTAGAAVQQWTCNGTAAQIWAPERPLAVMPLGDSITDGLNGTGGYRTDLWQLFRTDARYVDFMGSQLSGPWPRLGDANHEGHPGWRIDQIDAQVTGWLKTYRPDVVLLHLGTNDVLQDYSLSQAPSRLSGLIDHITAAVPSAHVYVATIVPFANASDESQAQTYNATIPGIVQAKVSAGKHVHLVAMHAALTKADLSDGVHPSNGGYSKMAARWYSKLNLKPMTRWEAENGANTLSDVSILHTANASGNTMVGYIDNADSYLEFGVSVPAAGTYRMYVRAGTGMTTPCGHAVTVNGQPAGELTYPNFGWDQWGIVAKDVTLRAGANAIRFAHSTCYAELDSIDLAD